MKTTELRREIPDADIAALAMRDPLIHQLCVTWQINPTMKWEDALSVMVAMLADAKRRIKEEHMRHMARCRTTYF